MARISFAIRKRKFSLTITYIHQQPVSRTSNCHFSKIFFSKSLYSGRENNSPKRHRFITAETGTKHIAKNTDSYGERSTFGEKQKDVEIFEERIRFFRMKTRWTIEHVWHDAASLRAKAEVRNADVCIWMDGWMDGWIDECT